jgi:hypothetical protein
VPHPPTSIGATSITTNSSSNKATLPPASLRRTLFHRSSIKDKRRQLVIPNLSSPLFPLLSPTSATYRPRLSPLLHTVSDTETLQGPISDYHGDTSIASHDIYNNFSHNSTNRNNTSSLELAITDSYNKRDISLLFENNKPELFDTKLYLSSPNNSISPTTFNKSIFDRADDRVLYSSASTTTTLLQLESTEGEGREEKYIQPHFQSHNEDPNVNKFLLFQCEREESLGEDESLLPLLPPTPDITPVGSPNISFSPTPNRNTAEFSASVQELLGNPSGGAEGQNLPFCESSEYYGDEDADHHLDIPLIVDALQEGEAAGNQPSPYIPELHSRGPMRHSAGSALSSSSYQAGSSTNRDKYFTPSSYSASSSYLRDRDLFGGGGSFYSYTGGRVPPTPPAHARPFSRSSSVPEQHYLRDFDPYDGLSKSSALNDYHTPFLGSNDKDPLSWQAALSNSHSSSKYGASRDLIGGHYRRQQRLNRLGKQLSLSSDLPTSAISDFPSSSGYNYLNDGFGLSRDRNCTGLNSIGGISSSALSRAHLSRGNHLTSHPLHDAGTSLHSRSGNTSLGKTALSVSSSYNNSRLLNRTSPLTLGKSLQLVTENFGTAAYNKEEINRRVNKKTVRFNSEGNYNPLSASSNVHSSSLTSSTLHPFCTTPGIYGDFSLNGTSSVDGTSNLLFGNHSNTLSGPSSYHHNPYLSLKHSKSRLFDEFDISCDDDAWMTIDDVRSGRWARWDTQRQESQDSQTRDSGIETGSCFTSSEDSNRGGIVADHYHSKKV